MYVGDQTARTGALDVDDVREEDELGEEGGSDEPQTREDGKRTCVLQH